MEADRKLINTFATRVRQMILQYEETRKENASLHATVEERDKTIERLKAQVTHMQHEYETLKMAKMMQLTDGDVDAAKKKVSKLIRDVNKCITLLSET